MKQLTHEQFKKQCTKPGRIWVLHNDGVLDLTKFAKEHPGGQNIIKAQNGRRIDNVIFNPMSYKHSPAILKKLATYKISTIVEKAPEPAAKKPVIPAKTTPTPIKKSVVVATPLHDSSKANQAIERKESANLGNCTEVELDEAKPNLVIPKFELSGFPSFENNGEEV